MASLLYLRHEAYNLGLPNLIRCIQLLDYLVNRRVPYVKALKYLFAQAQTQPYGLAQVPLLCPGWRWCLPYIFWILEQPSSQVLLGFELPRIGALTCNASEESGKTPQLSMGQFQGQINSNVFGSGSSANCICGSNGFQSYLFALFRFHRYLECHHILQLHLRLLRDYLFSTINNIRHVRYQLQ